MDEKEERIAYSIIGCFVFIGLSLLVVFRYHHHNSHTVRWQRFGMHSGHTLVGPAGFRADDLVQGKVGDCWFLSALAVVAERSDLISRLFGTMSGMNEYGAVEVRLFVDGFWQNIVLDNFLPCTSRI